MFPYQWRSTAEGCHWEFSPIPSILASKSLVVIKLEWLLSLQSCYLFPEIPLFIARCWPDNSLIPSSVAILLPYSTSL
jgi:hypothetical protein